MKTKAVDETWPGIPSHCLLLVGLIALIKRACSDGQGERNLDFETKKMMGQRIADEDSDDFFGGGQSRKVPFLHDMKVIDGF